MSNIAPASRLSAPASAPAVSRTTRAGSPDPGKAAPGRFGEVLAGPGAPAAAPGALTTGPAALADASRPALLDVLTRAAHGVAAAGGRLDSALTQVKKGGLTPDKLIKIQADVYEAGMTLQLAGKLVEKTTGGLKQVLQTQV